MRLLCSQGRGLSEGEHIAFTAKAPWECEVRSAKAACRSERGGESCGPATSTTRFASPSLRPALRVARCPGLSFVLFAALPLCAFASLRELLPRTAHFLRLHDRVTASAPGGVESGVADR